MKHHTPIFFDSCTHPTLNGLWTNGRTGITFQNLASIKRELPGYSALAIGLPGVGEYSHREFKRECDAWGFEGIAAVTTIEPTKVEREFDEIIKLGFRGVKVHPRLLDKNSDLDYLGRIFKLCEQRSLVCLLCTYEADRPGKLPSTDPFYQLCDALNEVSNVRLIMMHGGGSRLMQFASLARHSENLLVDLSFTLVDAVPNIPDTSVRQLMLKLDQRICIGTDSPEFRVDQVFRRVEEIAGILEPTKLANIFANNLLRFFPNRTSS